MLGEPQRDRSAERVADGDHALAVGVARSQRVREAVVLGQELARLQVRGRAEARQVDRHRAAVVAAELGERVAPGVGAVGEAVEQQERRALALELQ